ncbi:CCA tRNA nucleotidyltransferase, mitochondrial [Bonamia ostreae]|uniref:CCA tRNA nucleotidyltransferase, mitochondrial n=1 Tax=Bonamia ostreae TaxID=126728 RepID=A0ABV2AQ24_9EUKA
MEIFDVIFKIPRNVIFPDFKFEKNFFSIESQKIKEKSKTALNFVENNLLNFGSFKKNRPIWILSAILLPLAPFKVLYKKKEISLIRFIVENSLKLSSKMAEKTTNFCELALSLFLLNPLKNKDILNFGNFLAKCGDDWKEMIKFGQILFENNKNDEKDIFDLIVKLKIDNCHLWKQSPYFGGRELKNEFKIEPGPIYKKILDEQFNWRLLNPQSKKEDCRIWIQKKFVVKHKLI